MSVDMMDVSPVQAAFVNLCETIGAKNAHAISRYFLASLSARDAKADAATADLRKQLAARDAEVEWLTKERDQARAGLVEGAADFDELKAQLCKSRKDGATLEGDVRKMAAVIDGLRNDLAEARKPVENPWHGVFVGRTLAEATSFAEKRDDTHLVASFCFPGDARDWAAGHYPTAIVNVPGPCDAQRERAARLEAERQLVSYKELYAIQLDATHKSDIDSDAANKRADEAERQRDELEDIIKTHYLETRTGTGVFRPRQHGVATDVQFDEALAAYRQSKSNAAGGGK